MKNHQQSSHTQKFACISCTFSSESQMEYEEHVRTHMPQEASETTCDVCGFPKSSNEEHIHTCSKCKLLFVDVYELNRHEESEHSE